jgi:hypothetical protein
MVHLDRDPDALANTVLHDAHDEEPEAKVEETKDEKPAAKPSGLTSQNASPLVLGDRKVND